MSLGSSRIFLEHEWTFVEMSSIGNLNADRVHHRSGTSDKVKPSQTCPLHLRTPTPARRDTLGPSEGVFHVQMEPTYRTHDLCQFEVHSELQID